MLHECAQYNATECLIILSSYCGADLFQVINKEGQRAIDIAHRKQHTDCIVALQKLERNLMYSNAVFEREAKHQKESEDSRRHLPARNADIPLGMNYYENKSHLKHLRTRSKKPDDGPPTFKNYREEILKSESRKRKKDKYDESSQKGQKQFSPRQYYSQMRHQKNHQENFLGE